MQKRKDYVKTGEAARRLDVSAETIRRWIKSGRIRGHRVGGRFRVERGAVEEMANGRPQQAAAAA